jgi:5-methylthioadenosine/S-adenosylhomocysteine deaminase
MRLTSVHVNHILGMNELGLMGSDTCYIHCTDSTDEELDLIAETGGTTSVAPYVEMLMGHGVPPTGRLVERGIRPSLSVDVTSSVPGDMFTQMRTALVCERILAFTDSPDVAFAPTLTHRDVLEFATIDGARACALDDKVGSIKPGKQADLVLVRADQVNTAPLIDPAATVVVAADTSNVDSVWVAGKAVKRDGKLVGADPARLVGLVEESRDYLLSKAGLLPAWFAANPDLAEQPR